MYKFRPSYLFIHSFIYSLFINSSKSYRMPFETRSLYLFSNSPSPIPQGIGMRHAKAKERWANTKPE